MKYSNKLFIKRKSQTREQQQPQKQQPQQLHSEHQINNKFCGVLFEKLIMFVRRKHSLILQMVLVASTFVLFGLQIQLLLPNYEMATTITTAAAVAAANANNKNFTYNYNNNYYGIPDKSLWIEKSHDNNKRNTTIGPMLNTKSDLSQQERISLPTITTTTTTNHNHHHHPEDNSLTMPFLSLSSSIPSTNTNTTSTSSSLPSWMIEYMKWHQEQRRISLIPQAFTNSSISGTSNEIIPSSMTKRPKLLILQCTEQNVKCGGISDRLKPLPLILLGAYQSKRILLIRWRNRPAKLEEFMVPPSIDGNVNDDENNNNNDNNDKNQLILDWRVPDWLDDILDERNNNSNKLSRRHIINVQPFMKQLASSTNTDIVTTTLQWWDGGEQAYKDALQLDKDKDLEGGAKKDNDNNNDDEFRRVYHDLFRMLFRPTRPVQELLDEIYRTTPLKPYQYTVAHYRALWWEKQDPPTRTEQEETAQNAVRCASQLRSHVPIYFATDSKDAQQAMLEYAASAAASTAATTRRSIVVVPHSELVHLDRVPENTPIENVYPVFVDLWLLAYGNCVAFGDGGFGKYGLMLSADYTCSHRHIFRHKIQHCEWKE